MPRHSPHIINYILDFTFPSAFLLFNAGVPLVTTMSHLIRPPYFPPTPPQWVAAHVIIVPSELHTKTPRVNR